MSNPQNSGENQSYRYWAFISYSSKDKSWGHWLHRSIETYGIPAQLVSHPTPAGHPAPKHFQPIFRDRDELPASADLGAQVEEALRASRYLIVVCSRHAAQSRWVNKEIETFQKFNRHGRILAIIVDGEPNADDERECFPHALRQFEPIAADARPQGDGKSNAKLKLLAGMLGVSFDALKQRDSRRKKRRLQLILPPTLAVVIGFACLAWYGTHQAKSAQRERSKAATLTGEKRRLLFETDVAKGLQHLDEEELESSLGEFAEALEKGEADDQQSLIHRLRLGLTLNRFLPLEHFLNLPSQSYAGNFKSADFSPSSSLLIGQNTSEIYAYDLKRGKTLWKIKDSSLSAQHTLYDADWIDWAFSGDERVVCMLKGSARDRMGCVPVLLDARTGKVFSNPNGSSQSSNLPFGMQTSLTLNRDGRWLITKQRGGKIIDRKSVV